MIPVYILIGLINIYAKHSNYGIKIQDPAFNIRVRRGVQGTAIENNHNNDVDSYLKSGITGIKRYAYDNKPINTHDFARYSYTDREYERYINGGNLQNLNRNARSVNVTGNNENRYNIFNSTWKYLFNTTRYNRVNYNSGVTGNSYHDAVYVTNTTFNGNKGFHPYNINNPFSRSYPYGYPTGYGPNTNINGYNNVFPGYNSGAPTTPGYNKANSNFNGTPYFYNYQYPGGQNFAGYKGYNASRSGYSNITPVYNNFNNVPTPYSPGHAPEPINNNFNNIPAPYAPTNYPGFNNNNSYVPGDDYIHNILAPYPPGYNSKPINYTGLSNNKTTPWNALYGPGYIPNPGNNAGYLAYNNTFIYNNFNKAPVPYVPIPGNSSEYSNNRNEDPYTPGYNIPNRGKNTGYFEPNNASSGFNNFNNGPEFIPNLGNRKSGQNTTLTTEKILTGCVICRIPCPAFMKRWGGLCIPEQDDDEY